MRHRIAPVVAAIALMAGGAVRSDPAGGAENASQERIAQLVRSLGADDAKARESATKELEKIGEPAAPALRKAARSDDPEVAWRARTILDHVEGARPAQAKPRQDGAGPEDASRLHSFNFRFSPGASDGSVIITQDGSGGLSVTVMEDEGGKRVTKTYEAESAEAFKERHPEVAKRYGIGEPGVAPRILRDFMPRGLGRLGEDWGLDEDFFRRDWPREFGEDLGRLHDRMRGQMEELFRQHQMDPWGEKLLRRFKDRLLPDEAPAPPKKEGEQGAEAQSPDPAPRDGDRPAPGTLGLRIEDVEPALRDQLKLGAEEGVLVGEVVPGSRAERAGFKPYDVIAAVNGAAVKGVWELRRVLREEEGGPGREIEFAVIRGGERRTVKIQQAAR